MTGYWVVRASAIKDEQAQQQYLDCWDTIAQRYGAEVIAGRGNIDTREGAHFPRQLIIRFPSYIDAISCYEYPGYQAAMEFANKAFDRELSIIEG